jgi:nucleotide-binding universal stress UspA family protein
MNILVGYNGSNESKEALKLAREHAKELGAKIEIATSIARIEPMKYYDIQEAEQELEWGVEDILNGDETPYETHLLVNAMSIGDQLVEFAETHNIDGIIIGVKKRSKVGKILFGSTAQYVILNAPCPVVTVK